MVSILATYSQFLTLSAVRMKDPSYHVTSLLTPPREIHLTHGESQPSHHGPQIYGSVQPPFHLSPSPFLGFLLQSCQPLCCVPTKPGASHLRPLCSPFPLRFPPPALCCCCYRLVAKLRLTLCDPTDCSPPGSSVHGIFQARILEWVAIYSSRGAS